MARISVEAVTDAEGTIDPGKVDELIADLSRDAEEDRIDFERPEQPENAARSYLREGVGQALGIYILLRTGGRNFPFSPSQFESLEGAMNTWFELYALCYGVELEADFSIRTAAELLIETDNLADVAEVLTGVP